MHRTCTWVLGDGILYNLLFCLTQCLVGGFYSITLLRTESYTIGTMHLDMESGERKMHVQRKASGNLCLATWDFLELKARGEGVTLVGFESDCHG